MNRKQRRIVRKTARIGLSAIKGSASGSLIAAGLATKAQRRQDTIFGGVVGGGVAVIDSLADELVRLKRKPWWRRWPW